MLHGFMMHGSFLKSNCPLKLKLFLDCSLTILQLFLAVLQFCFFQFVFPCCSSMLFFHVVLPFLLHPFNGSPAEFPVQRCAFRWFKWPALLFWKITHTKINPPFLCSQKDLFLWKMHWISFSLSLFDLSRRIVGHDNRQTAAFGIFFVWS